MHLVDAARLRLGAMVLVLVALVAGAVAGAVSASTAVSALALVAGLLLISLTVYRPVVLAIIALIAVFASHRVGSTALVSGNQRGVSYSDALLAAATVMSIPALLGTKQLHRLRLAGWGVAVYLACLLPTVLLNFSSRGYLEWLHRLVLLGGSLMVGAWITRDDTIRPALRLLTFASSIVALATVANALRHGFAHTAPFGMNKNFVGGMLAMVVVLVFVARQHLAFKTPWWIAFVCTISAGVIASHSRGGALAATVGLFLAVVLQGRLHRRSTKWLAVLVAGILAAFVYTTVRHQLHQSQAVASNGSLGVRFNVEHAARDIWRTSPTYGVGLKYFNTHHYGIFGSQPANNVVDNELAESGVIGLTGFAILQGTVLLAGFRRGRTDPLAAAAFGMVAGTLAHGLVDIYWTAGTVTLPFIIMGMALAQEPSDQIRHPVHKASTNRHAERRPAFALTGEH